MASHARMPEYALSIRQPWAALVVLGLKTIEIRRWTTPLRGPIYIHAVKIADERREGWSRVPQEHYDLTALGGGADVIDVKDPARGSLGRPDENVLEEVRSALGGRCAVSAALG